MELFRGAYSEAPVLWMDTGSFAGDTSWAGQYQTRTLIEGMNRLGYAAVNVTDRELAVGIPEFRDLAKDAQFTLVSANVIYQGSNLTLFPAFTVKKLSAESWRGDRELKIGVLGLTRENPAFLLRGDDGRKVVIAPPILAAKRVVPVLEEMADVVIVLANLNTIVVDKLVREVPGIDLVLAGYGGRVFANHAHPPGTAIVYAGNQGKRIGEIRLFLGGQGLAGLTTTHIFLDRRYPYNSSLKQFEDAANISINEHYRARADSVSVSSAHYSRGETFVGHGACAGCHASVHEGWVETTHADALETLVEVNQEFSPLCIQCHVTGYEQANGFRNPKATPGFGDVQCEACHGPGGGHVDDASQPYANADAAQCLTCHTEANSPEFQFSTYWELIKH